MKDDNRRLAFAETRMAANGAPAEMGTAINADLLQLKPENLAVEQIAFWAAPPAPERLLLCGSGRCERIVDEIQALATTMTETLEEILHWHGKHPEPISQFERDQWLVLSERGVHHGGLNERGRLMG